MADEEPDPAARATAPDNGGSTAAGSSALSSTAAGAPISRSPVARSPIAPRPPVRTHHGWEVSDARAGGPLRLIDLTPLSKTFVRAAPGSEAARRLDCDFGATRRDSDGSLVVGAGPDEWFVLAPTGRRAALMDQLEPAQANGTDKALLSVMDMTHGSVVIRLVGADSRSVLEKICAIDLHDRVTPNGTSFRSSVARLRCTVVRDDVGPERSYLIESDRSSGQYLFDAVLDAGAEFAIEVAGYPDKEI